MAITTKQLSYNYTEIEDNKMNK